MLRHGGGGHTAEDIILWAGVDGHWTKGPGPKSIDDFPLLAVRNSKGRLESRQSCTGNRVADSGHRPDRLQHLAWQPAASEPRLDDDDGVHDDAMSGKWSTTSAALLTSCLNASNCRWRSGSPSCGSTSKPATKRSCKSRPTATRRSGRASISSDVIAAPRDGIPRTRTACSR